MALNPEIVQDGMSRQIAALRERRRELLNEADKLEREANILACALLSYQKERNFAIPSLTNS